MVYYDLAQAVGASRRILGITQVQLAALTSISLPTIQQIEAGRANPAIGTVNSVFGALGLRLAYEPQAVNWSVLRAGGLPTGGNAEATRPPTADELIRELRHALLDYERGALAAAPRLKEALGATFAALQCHFPRSYARHFGRCKAAMELVQQLPRARLIKLKRLAHARLAEVL